MRQRGVGDSGREAVGPGQLSGVYMAFRVKVRVKKRVAVYRGE